MKALHQLNDRENKLWNFGLGSLERGKDAKDVADMLGISQSYISRLEKES